MPTLSDVRRDIAFRGVAMEYLRGYAGHDWRLRRARQAVADAKPVADKTILEIVSVMLSDPDHRSSILQILNEKA